MLHQVGDIHRTHHPIEQAQAAEEESRSDEVDDDHRQSARDGSLGSGNLEQEVGGDEHGFEHDEEVEEVACEEPSDEPASQHQGEGVGAATGQFPVEFGPEGDGHNRQENRLKRDEEGGDRVGRKGDAIRGSPPAEGEDDHVAALGLLEQGEGRRHQDGRRQEAKASTPEDRGLPDPQHQSHDGGKTEEGEHRHDGSLGWPANSAARAEPSRSPSDSGAGRSSARPPRRVWLTASHCKFRSQNLYCFRVLSICFQSLTKIIFSSYAVT